MIIYDAEQVCSNMSFYIYVKIVEMMSHICAILVITNYVEFIRFPPHDINIVSFNVVVNYFPIIFLYLELSFVMHHSCDMFFMS